MKKHKYTNHLIHETSPYLLQHAHNPVNWHAWNNEALQKAKAEDKPILISIGYSACHWCHVMERESFEDEATAQIMNEHFINIKIDREERPDIDHLYMDAVQAITGSGGWPLNVFLTSDLKPFFGGTYFPPVRAFNRSSWKEVLLAVANSYKEKRNEITEQAENLLQHLSNANNLNAVDQMNAFGKKSLYIINDNLLKLSDKEWGGFGQAPKFPQSFSILYLLRHYHFDKDKAALNAATLSLDKMMMGGIYDHLGGGFCRYSTDKSWQIPHFEKMLYDNALLLDAYIEAYQITKKEQYKTVVAETIQFIKREMTSPEGGFYSALDADSEGVEGKYYTWNKTEIDELLGEKSELFCRVYNVLENGNWENANILWQPELFEKIAGEFGISEIELENKIKSCEQILFKARQKRIRPGLDNKILLSWNALMSTALCKAYAAFGNEEYLKIAKANIAFIEENLFDKNGNLLHGWNKIANPQQAFLDDHASLIHAYIVLSQVTADSEYFLRAKSLTEKTSEFFGDDQNIFFYFTPKNQTDVLIRKIEIYDGATPSGNALMAGNLLELSIVFGISQWRNRAEQMLSYISKFAERYPTSFGVWALHLQLLIYGVKEIVVIGEDYRSLIKQVLQEYIPSKILQASGRENNEWPLLKDKLITSKKTKIYICENYSCLRPAESFEEFKNQLTKHF